MRKKDMSFDLGLDGKSAVITGGGGAICGKIAAALAGQGVRVAVWDLSREKGEKAVENIERKGGQAFCLQCDVTDPHATRKAASATLERFGSLEILVNGAGGSLKQATTSDELEFFDLPAEGMNHGMALNYAGTVYSCQAVGRMFAEQGSGAILNISSIAGINPLTRAITYSDAKAAVNSFTRWLAVHMATTYSAKIRVNALAPGFILTDQNRFLLFDEHGGCFTERGQAILQAVPMARLGDPAEIVGGALWLLSEQASFVTGAVIPVDGGFTAFCGV